MNFYYISFAACWVAWLIFADKNRWRELLPTGFFAGFLGASLDLFIHHYPLWMYDYDLSTTPELLNDWGIYIVFSYLFIQWLPKHRTVINLLGYWLVWTAIAVIIEFVYLKTGHMTHHKWWNLWLSYFHDWLLLWIFYYYHKTFQFERLSQKPQE